MYTNFTFCFSFWGTGAQGTFVPQTPWPSPHNVNPLHCKILGTLIGRGEKRLESHVRDASHFRKRHGDDNDGDDRSCIICIHDIALFRLPPVVVVDLADRGSICRVHLSAGDNY